MPSLEKIQQELGKAQSIDDFFSNDRIFGRVLAETIETMLEAELTAHRGYEKYKAKAPAIFAEPPDSVDEEAQAQLIDLERMVGKLALENEILKKAKSLLSVRPKTNGRL